MCIASRSLDKLEASAEAISAVSGRAVHPYQMDIRDHEQVQVGGF